MTILIILVAGIALYLWYIFVPSYSNREGRDEGTKWLKQWPDKRSANEKDGIE